jgi:hypothetical protein
MTIFDEATGTTFILTTDYLSVCAPEGQVVRMALSPDHISQLKQFINKL